MVPTLKRDSAWYATFITYCLILKIETKSTKVQVLSNSIVILRIYGYRNPAQVSQNYPDELRYDIECVYVSQ